MEEKEEKILFTESIPEDNPIQLEGVDINQEEINANSRMTPEYKAMLEAKMRAARELEENSRNIPLPESETDKKKKALQLQINNQKTIIEANRKALFGKKAKIRKAAQKKLQELEAEISELEQ